MELSNPAYSPFDSEYKLLQGANPCLLHSHYDKLYFLPFTIMTIQEKFESLTTEQYISLLDNYEWNIRLNRIWEKLHIDWKEQSWTFFIVYAKDKRKNINIWLSKSPQEAIKKASFKLWSAGWFTNEQINAI